MIYTDSILILPFRLVASVDDEKTDSVKDAETSSDDSGMESPKDAETSEDTEATEDAKTPADDTERDASEDKKASREDTDTEAKETAETSTDEEETDGNTLGEGLVLSDELTCSVDHIAATNTCLSFGVFFLIGLLLARMAWGRLK